MSAAATALRRLPPAARAALVLAALTFAMFADVLLAGPGIVVSHEQQDAGRLFLAWREFGFSEIAAGRFPLWNPHLFCGNPFFGGFQSALLYPPNLLHLVLPVARAVNISVALHVFLFGFLTYLWVTRRGVRPAGGLVAAGIAAFGGGFLAHVHAGHLAHLCTMAWTPLVLLAVDDAFRRPGLRPALLGGAALALQVLAGHPQFVLLTGLAAGLYAALRFVSSPRRLPAAAVLLGVVALGAGLSAAQWMTSLQESPDTFRGGAGLPFALSAEYSLPPENLLCLAAPGVFGENRLLPYFGRWFLWEVQPYFGLAGLALALLGAALGRREHRLFSAPLAALCLLLALGEHTPLFVLLHEHVPGFAAFRCSGRFLFPFTLFCAALAGAGVHALFDGARGPRAGVLAAWALAALLAGTAVLAARLGEQGRFETTMRAVTGGDESPMLDWTTGPEFARKAARNAVLWLSLGAGVAAGVAALLAIRRRAAICLLAALAVAEPFAFGRFAHRPTFDLAHERLPGLRAFLAAQRGEGRTLNAVCPNEAMRRGNLDIWGYDSFALRRYLELVYATQGWDPDDVGGFLTVPGVNRTHPLLSMLRCRARILPVEGVVVTIPAAVEPLPRALLVGRYRVAPDRDSALAAVTAPDFDPRSTVVLSRPPVPAPAGDGGPFGTVTVRDEDTDELTVEAELTAPAILLITDSYSPHWRAVPLGPAPQDAYEVLPANHALRAIPLAAGRHRFRLEYRPSRFEAGVRVSLASLALALAASIALALARHRRPSQGSF